MRNILLFFFFFVIIPFIPCEEVLFRVIEDTPAWYYDNNKLTKENIVMILKKDEIVKGAIIRYSKDTVDGEKYFFPVIVYNNKKYLVQADMLVPATTDSLFDDSWITSLYNGPDVYWIRDCYLGVLLSKNRETFYEFEYKSIDGHNKLKELTMYLPEEWYEVNRVKTCLELNQTTVYAGGFFIRGFWIANITAINNGYRVTVVDPDYGEPFSIDNTYFFNPIPFPTNKPSFDLLLIKDNDFLSMYLDSTENHLATFVRVNKAVIDELNSLLEKNTCDLSKITSWPKRVDGSMDYPLPSTLEEEKQPEPIELSIESADTENQQTAQNSAKKSGMPLWARLAIIGGVLIAGGAAVFVIKRRKS